MPISSFQLAREILGFNARVAFASRGLGLTVTSRCRDPITNRRVGGDPHSQHLACLGPLALAVDFVGTPAQELALARRLEGSDVVVVREGDHLHVQRFGAGVLVAMGWQPPRA